MQLVVASNLIKLRQQAGMTQAELGEKLNYSDKTVSKWERGESLPDAYVLMRLAEMYGLTVDDLLHEGGGPKGAGGETSVAEAGPTFSSTVVILVAIVGIWTMAVLTFVVSWLATNTIQWLIFASAVPVSLITLLVLNSVWNKGRHNMIIIMLLVAAIVTLVYLFLLAWSWQPWQLFLILIPAELLVFLCFRIRRRERKKINTSEEVSP